MGRLPVATIEPAERRSRAHEGEPRPETEQYRGHDEAGRLPAVRVMQPGTDRNIEGELEDQRGEHESCEHRRGQYTIARCRCTPRRFSQALSSSSSSNP